MDTKVMDQQSNKEEGSSKAQCRDLMNANASNSNRLEDLPIEVAEKILDKLSFPCLFRCKFLSKSFSTTMNNMSFSLKDHFLYFKLQKSLYYLNLDSANQISEHKIAYRPIQVNIHLSNFHIMGSCNGYLCLSSTSSSSPSNPKGQSNTLIFNPFMPCAIKNLPSESMELSWASGFGFNQKTNEHKVVRIYPMKGLLRDSLKQHVRISSVGTNRSRSLSTPCGIRIRSRTATCARGVYLDNGCIYWLGERQREKLFVVVELNTDKEEFKAIPPPPDDEAILKDCDFYLVKRRGQLVLVVINYAKDKLQIWVLEDQFSWRKLGSERLKMIDRLLKDVDRESLLSGLYNSTLYDVIWVEHDHLLLQFERVILCYDLTRKRFLDFEVEGLSNLGAEHKEFEMVVGHGSVLGIERCT